MAIAITSLGTLQKKATNWRETLALASLTWSAGDLIVVCISSDLPLTFDGPTWPCRVNDGSFHDMVEDEAINNSGNVSLQILSYPNVAARSGNGYISIYNENDSDAQQAIVFAVYAISGIVTSSPLDKSASATGSGTTGNSGATATLSQADEAIIGAVAGEDEVDDMTGTWTTGAGNVSGNEQAEGTNGAGDASNVNLYTAAEVVSATTAQTAEVTGMDSIDWAAAIATYKAAPAGNIYNRSCTVALAGPSLSLARVGTFGRAPSRVGSVSISLGRVGDFSRAPSRVGSVSVSLDKSVAHPRSVSRVGSVATSLARTLTNLRGMTRTGSVVTSVAKAVTFVRGVTRTGSVSVSAVAAVVIVRTASRVGSVATSLARSLTNLRGVTRTGSVATSLAKVATIGRAISRVGSVATSLARSMSVDRSATRTGAVSTVLEWTATIGRQVSRVGSVATSLVRSGEFSRAVTRTGSVATSVARELISEGVEFFTGMYRRIIG